MKGYNIALEGYNTCNSSGVIYMIKCPCGKAYIGQTSRSIKIRLTEHRSSIRTYRKEKDRQETNKYGESTVARHFYEMRRNISDLRWVVIEKVFGNDESQIKTRLLQREVHWIVTLDTKAPNGLNEILALMCSYSTTKICTLCISD